MFRGSHIPGIIGHVDDNTSSIDRYAATFRQEHIIVIETNRTSLHAASHYESEAPSDIGSPVLQVLILSNSMMTRVISFKLIIAAISLALHNGGDIQLPNFELIVIKPTSRTLATPQPRLCQRSL